MPSLRKGRLRKCVGGIFSAFEGLCILKNKVNIVVEKADFVYLRIVFMMFCIRSMIVRVEALLTQKSTKVVFMNRFGISRHIVFFIFSLLLLSGGFVRGEDTVRGSTGVTVAQELIYQGRFEMAGDWIEQSGNDEDPKVAQLSKVVAEYKVIEDRRRSGKKEVYEEQIAELDKIERAMAGEDVNGVTIDANTPTKVLAIVAGISKFADEGQKQEILRKPFVKQMQEKALVKAVGYESEGKWLEAYLCSYLLLERIYEDNEVYTDHGDELLDKANLLATFQDSPCETSAERYKGVKKAMFIKALGYLKFNYVNYLDYRAMTHKAFERCVQLAEVMTVSYDEITESGSALMTETGLYSPPSAAQLSSWKKGLGDISTRMDESFSAKSMDDFIDVFEDVLVLNKKTVKIPEQILIGHFSEACLEAMDKYTVIIWPEQVKPFDKAINNEFTGVGIHISKEKGFLKAISLLPDTPAYHSGLDAGDIIVKVDGVDTKDMPISCAVKHIMGPRGTPVTLTIQREGQEGTRDFTIIRDRIKIASVRGWQREDNGKWLYMVDEESKIGYVRLTSFAADTSKTFEKVLRGLEKDGMRGLVLDLRYNTGGLLRSAADISDKFVGEGLIVRTQPRFGMPNYEVAHRRGTHPDYPLVVLTNRYSASASEIVAGALGDDAHERAILIGERTHGKGSVQGITSNIGGGAKLKYTMAYYHLPSGQRVESKEAMKKLGRDDWGVGPDIKIVLRPDERNKMDDIQWDNGVLVKADHDNAKAPVKKHSIEDTLAADPQLAVGLLVIKTKLMETGAVAVKN